jgi:hypothetical protein
MGLSMSSAPPKSLAEVSSRLSVLIKHTYPSHARLNGLPSLSVGTSVFMTRPDSVGNGNDGDPDADPDMMRSGTDQPNQAEGDDDE